MTLGIFDSGVGGLTLWSELKALSSNAKTLYLADTANIPYGDLPKEKICAYSKEALFHLKDLGATAIAIACHTVSTTINPLREGSFPLPIFDIATHSLSLLARFPRISLIGTKATIASGFYQKALGERLIQTKACPLLAPMIEQGCIDPSIVKKSLEGIDPDTDVLFLACTHFPLIQDLLHSFLPNTSLINPAPSFAKELLPLTTLGEDLFYTTKEPKAFETTAGLFPLTKKVPSPFLIKSLYSPLVS